MSYKYGLSKEKDGLGKPSAFKAFGIIVAMIQLLSSSKTPIWFGVKLVLSTCIFPKSSVWFKREKYVCL